MLPGYPSSRRLLADDDVVDRDVDQLHEEADETHNAEADQSRGSRLQELCGQKTERTRGQRTAFGLPPRGTLTSQRANTARWAQRKAKRLMPAQGKESRERWRKSHLSGPALCTLPTTACC